MLCDEKCTSIQKLISGMAAYILIEKFIYNDRTCPQQPLPRSDNGVRSLKKTYSLWCTYWHSLCQSLIAFFLILPSHFCWFYFTAFCRRSWACTPWPPSHACLYHFCILWWRVGNPCFTENIYRLDLYTPILYVSLYKVLLLLACDYIMGLFILQFCTSPC